METKMGTHIQVTEELLGRGGASTPAGCRTGQRQVHKAAWGAFRNMGMEAHCFPCPLSRLCLQKHGNGSSPLSLPPVQAVLQEKDKFGDYCTSLWYIYLRIRRGKWYTMLSVMGLAGTPLAPAYVHPWVDPRVPITPELPQASTESLEYSHCDLDITEEDTKVQKSSWTGFRK